MRRLISLYSRAHCSKLFSSSFIAIPFWAPARTALPTITISRVPLLSTSATAEEIRLAPVSVPVGVKTLIVTLFPLTVARGSVFKNQMLSSLNCPTSASCVPLSAAVIPLMFIVPDCKFRVVVLGSAPRLIGFPSHPKVQRQTVVESDAATTMYLVPVM